MLDEKDQIAASRICRTMPIYIEILEENGMHVMNKKITWFRAGKKSLIDHIATNSHQHIKSGYIRSWNGDFQS